MFHKMTEENYSKNKKKFFTRNFSIFYLFTFPLMRKKIVKNTKDIMMRHINGSIQRENLCLCSFEEEI